MISIGPRIRIPEQEFEFTYARSGGPGGQNVNKVNSKAILRWPLTQSENLPPDVKERFIEKYGGRLTTDGELILTSQRYRDQVRNTEDCLEKLTAMLESVAARPIPRRETKPTLAAKRRRVESKREMSQKKQGRRAPTKFDD